MLMQERDRLRKLADELRTHGTFYGFGGTESRDPLMYEAAEAMENAADTIWDLHKKFVAANAGARKAQEENAKLRELLKNALTYIEYEGCGVECPETGNSATLTSCDACNRYETESCAYVIAQSARELGVETS